MATLKLPKKPKGDVEKAEPTVNPQILPTVEAPDVVKNSDTSKPKLLELPKGNEADMQKVRDYQIKLNKKGAGLVVDGIWGDKTATASKEYYNRYQKNQGSPKIANINTQKDKVIIPAKSINRNTSKVDTSAAASYFKSKSKSDNEIVDYNQIDGTPITRKNSREDTEKVKQIVKKLETEKKESKPSSSQPSIVNPTQIAIDKGIQSSKTKKSLTSFLNTEGNKTATMEARRATVMKDRKDQEDYYRSLITPKKAKADLDSQIEEARKSGDSKRMNQLINKKSLLR